MSREKRKRNQAVKDTAFDWDETKENNNEEFEMIVKRTKMVQNETEFNDSITQEESPDEAPEEIVEEQETVEEEKDPEYAILLDEEVTIIGLVHWNVADLPDDMPTWSKICNNKTTEVYLLQCSGFSDPYPCSKKYAHSKQKKAWNDELVHMKQQQ
jgi:hypothetical protein